MDLVHQSEFDLVNAENEHVKLSPRAIDQGWDKRLKEDMENHRRDVTELKKRALFEVALDMREARDRHEKNEAALSEMQYHVTTTEEQIEAEKQAIARVSRVEVACCHGACANNEALVVCLVCVSEMNFGIGRGILRT